MNRSSRIPASRHVGLAYAAMLNTNELRRNSDFCQKMKRAVRGAADAQQSISYLLSPIS